jgi:hypothetical protein
MNVAKPNYSFQKRQRELAKKHKKEEKAQRKLDKNPAPGDATAESPEVSAPVDKDKPAGNI